MREESEAPDVASLIRATRCLASGHERAPAAATVKAIAAGSQHSTINNISHRTATSGATPAIIARYWIGPAEASIRERSPASAARCACSPTSVAVAACRCVSSPSRVTRCCVAMLMARVTRPSRVEFVHGPVDLRNAAVEVGNRSRLRLDPGIERFDALGDAGTRRGRHADMRLDQLAEHAGGVDEREAGDQRHQNRAHFPVGPPPMRGQPSRDHQLAGFHGAGEHHHRDRITGKYLGHARDRKIGSDRRQREGCDKGKGAAGAGAFRRGGNGHRHGGCCGNRQRLQQRVGRLRLAIGLGDLGRLLFRLGLFLPCALADLALVPLAALVRVDAEGVRPRFVAGNGASPDGSTPTSSAGVATNRGVRFEALAQASS